MTSSIAGVPAQRPGRGFDRLALLCATGFVLLVSLLLVSLGAEGAGSQPVGHTQRVLILFSDERLLPANVIIDDAIRAALAADAEIRIELFSEYFDLARFPGEEQQRRQREFFREKYRERGPDLVIAVSNAAMAFVAGRDGELFPGVPIVYCSVSGDGIPERAPGARVIDIPVVDTLPPTLQIIERLHPGAHVAILTGTSPRDRALADAVRNALPVGGKQAFSWLTDLSMQSLRDALSAMPDDTVVLYLTMFQDAVGETFTPREALDRFAPASRVPIYAYYDSYLGHGIVGGSMVTFEKIGRKAGQMSVRVLRGEDDRTAAAADMFQPIPMFDWRQLRRWDISDASLPPGSVVQFKESTYWERDPWMVVAWISLALIEALLIGLLIAQLHRRRLAEASRRETEQRMTLAMQAASMGFWIHDLERNEIWASETWRQLFEFSATERLDFETILKKVHGEDRASLRRALEVTLAREGRYDIEFRLILRDGNTRWIASQGTIQSEGNRPSKLMRGVCSDCTLRKQNEQETVQLRQEIAHVGRVSTMGQLASALAHEINQPLGAILRNAEAAEMFLQSTSPDLEEVRAILADIRSDNGRATTVIGRMRRLLKRNELDAELLDVNELVGDVAALVRSDARARRVSLDVSVSRDLLQTRGDRAHLQQVLLNLIINGMDAAGTADVIDRRVGVKARLDDSNLIEVAVSDTGPGVPDAIRTNVFEPFFTTKSNGMGMGLAISNSIIAAHGGRLWIDPDDGAGATFRFTLPVAEAELT